MRPPEPKPPEPKPAAPLEPPRIAPDKVVTASPQAPIAMPEPKPKAPEPLEAMVAPPPTAPRSQVDSRIFQDCPDCPAMVKIPGGSFMMGAAQGDPSAAPQHKATVAPFALGRYPVTVAEWRACTADKGCSSLPKMHEFTDQTPVHNISWDDARQYIAWISKKTGKKYRLPSETEWEYAARAGTTTRYWWGDEVGTFLANCSDCGGKQKDLAPLPVGSFKPNPFGLHDMSGGVSQWTADCWFPNYHGAPSDGSPRDKRGCQERVLRGGSFRNDRTTIASSSRNHYDASVRYLDHGFRVARGLD
jgi:formylglycine-generating enzyme required for sulfatase activity